MMRDVNLRPRPAISDWHNTGAPALRKFCKKPRATLWSFGVALKYFLWPVALSMPQDGWV
jgi:hypothetical protein